MCLAAQSCPTPCDPIDYSLPGSSICGILQARKLEWVAIPFYRGSSRPRDQTWVCCITGRFFTIWATREAHIYMHKIHIKQYSQVFYVRKYKQKFHDWFKLIKSFNVCFFLLYLSLSTLPSKLVTWFTEEQLYPLHPPMMSLAVILGQQLFASLQCFSPFIFVLWFYAHQAGLTLGFLCF